MRTDWRQRLDAEFEAGQSYLPNKADWLDKRWAGVKAAQALADDDRRGKTGVDVERLKQIGERITPCGTASTFIRRSCASSRTAGRRSRKARGSTGRPPRRSLSPPCSAPGFSGSPVRPGQRTGNVLAAPFGADRPADGGATSRSTISATGRPATRSSTRCCRAGGARLRIWLFARRAQRACHVGGAVRRFRQWRAGGVRPVRLGRRAEMAAHVGPRVLPAARI